LSNTILKILSRRLGTLENKKELRLMHIPNSERTFEVGGIPNNFKIKKK
jgi:hypothetical protein